MSVTIKDLAKKTGLGTATISAYLNGVAVRSYNKEKIEKAIDELGYIRNDYARGLKTHASKTIGVLIPELSSIFATTIIGETEEILRGKGYGTIVCDCRSDTALEQTALKFLLSKMVDGLIVMPVTTDGRALMPALDNGVPVTVIDRLTDCAAVSHVVIDNREISKTATERLLAEGRRRIALVTGGDEVYTARERRLGYLDALNGAGHLDAARIYDGGLSVEGGYCAAIAALTDDPETDAVFATNYEMTVGCMLALNETEKKIGAELSLFGFDNVELARVIAPRIETVKQPLKEMGRVAAETILSRIAGEPPIDIVLKATIESNGRDGSKQNG